MNHGSWARSLARQLLAESLPQRWAHTIGVGSKAESIAHVAGPDADLLISVSWLHDIGYAPSAASTGFHPLDGGRYLRDVAGADADVCRLVANHSCAIVEARNRGLGDTLAAEFPELPGLVADALLFCDLTTAPSGECTDFVSRLAEVRRRFGKDSSIGRSVEESRPHILRSIERVTSLLSSHR